MTEAETRIAAALARTEGRRQVTLRREDALWVTGSLVVERASAKQYKRWAAFDRQAADAYRDYGDKCAVWGASRIPFHLAWSMAAGLSAAAALGGWLVGHA